MVVVVVREIGLLKNTYEKYLSCRWGKGGSDDAPVGHPFDAALTSPLREPNAVAMAD